MKAFLLTLTLGLLAFGLCIAQDNKDAKDAKSTKDSKVSKDTKDSKESKDGKESKDSKESKDPFENYAEESLKALEKVADSLAGVKDRKTADEARAKLSEVTKPLGELRRKLAENEPTKERKAELEKKYKFKFEAAIKRFREEAGRSTAIEGGKELLDELDRLLKPLVPKKG